MPPVQNLPVQNLEEQNKQQEKERTENAAAATGARAVADAVAKVANAAADAASQTGGPAMLGEFFVIGVPGGTFELRAPSNIFSSSGTVLVGGKAQTTYEWGANYIRGKFDEGVKSGEVVVQIDSQTRRVGYFKG